MKVNVLSVLILIYNEEIIQNCPKYSFIAWICIVKLCLNISMLCLKFFAEIINQRLKVDVLILFF